MIDPKDRFSAELSCDNCQSALSVWGTESQDYIFCNPTCHEEWLEKNDN